VLVVMVFVAGVGSNGVPPTAPVGGCLAGLNGVIDVYVLLCACVARACGVGLFCASSSDDSSFIKARMYWSRLRIFSDTRSFVDPRCSSSESIYDPSYACFVPAFLLIL